MATNRSHAVKAEFPFVVVHRNVFISSSTFKSHISGHAGDASQDYCDRLALLAIFFVNENKKDIFYEDENGILQDKVQLGSVA